MKQTFHLSHQHLHRKNFNMTDLQFVPLLRKWIKKCFTKYQRAL